MGLEVNINTLKKEINNLTRDKLVVVCGSASNTGKNQTTEGLKYMTNFVKKRKNTNVVITRMSHKFELEVLLCTDNEVKVFNRKM
jgi:replicative DNA helicase